MTKFVNREELLVRADESMIEKAHPIQNRYWMNEDGHPDYNYKCQQCSQRSEINDYKSVCPNWCDKCDKVTNHKRL